VDVARHLLTRAGTGEQLQEHRQVRHPTNNLFDTRDDDVHRGRRRTQTAVAFIFDHDDGARFRNHEIGAGYARTGMQVPAA